MPYCISSWVPLGKEFSCVNKNLSRAERRIKILAQSNTKLLKKDKAWAETHKILLEKFDAKDKELQSCKAQLSLLKNSYAILRNQNSILEGKITILVEDKYILNQKIDDLTDTNLELRSLTTPFSCDGASAEDYLNLEW
jgi:chromosome segregation ATPase